MIADFIALRLDVEALKTAFGNAIAIGPVEEIDAQKGYRLKLGEEDGEPYLSPWLPHPETGKTSVPLKKGQIVGSLNPAGDPRQGFLLRGGYSDEHASPNDNMGANVFRDAGVTITVADGKVVIDAPGGVFITGDRVEHDGKNIGKNHTHGGIVPGGGDTDMPNA